MARPLGRKRVLPQNEPPRLILPGPLQLVVLGSLWRSPEGITFRRLVREVRQNYKEVAESTISTTITRLIDRQWAVRRRTGLYQPGISRDELTVLIINHIREA